MAKNQAARRSQNDGAGSQAETSERHTLNPIQAPDAPAVMHCEEVGAPVARDQAIREKVRLYPQASVNEIVAMFELEGVKILPAAVQQAKRG